MAKLILTSGEHRQEFELAAINTIGRHPDNSIQILDRIISKEHAQILRGGDGHFLLRDLGSLNGTYVSRRARVASICSSTATSWCSARRTSSSSSRPTPRSRSTA